MEHPLVSVNLVVWNGEKYLRQCLQAVKEQTYPNLKLVVFDNHSTDGTKAIVTKEFPEFYLIENDINYGFGPGQNRCMRLTKGKYILGLCVDVMLDKDFVRNAVAIMEHHPDVGALQAKIYQLKDGKPTHVIDTTGFEIYRSRRIVNRGHGEADEGQFNAEGEVFSYEGAAPFWRREALENSSVFGAAHDEDFFWYADDIDLGWRMRLLGWKSWYQPRVIAYHDRSTTKRLSGSKLDFIRLRRTIPKLKRRLDWQNMHFTFLKNDFLVSELKSAPQFFAREFLLLCYIILWEPFILFAIPRIICLAPRMLKKRAYIMRHKKTSRHDMERWFI